MPKPFSIQAPEEVAKEYGGNKQKIAQAAQMGLVDPTAAVLAGMFIDRMRGAQMQEAVQPPTVAQQVFAPPMPGAMPPGTVPTAPPAPPMGGMPPVPPMGGMPPAPPTGAPPMGMAEGGLAALPIPDQMFDEPDNGGYAGGGIVAFAGAGLTSQPDYATLRQMMVDYADEAKGREAYSSYYQPKTEAAQRLRQLYGDVLSEEGQKKRRDEDKWYALAQLGATMASTPGSLLQAASAGIGKALPIAQEAGKERRAEQRDAIKQLALDEGMTNAEAREFAKYMLDRQGKRADIAQSLAQLTSGDARTAAQIASSEKISAADNAARLAAARAGGREKGPDLMDRAVMARFMAMKQNNATRPLPKPGEKFNRNIHRWSDESLLSKAYEDVMGSRYGDRTSSAGGMSLDAIRNLQGGAGGQPPIAAVDFDSLK